MLSTGNAQNSILHYNNLTILSQNDCYYYMYVLNTLYYHLDLLRVDINNKVSDILTISIANLFIAKGFGLSLSLIFYIVIVKKLAIIAKKLAIYR